MKKIIFLFIINCFLLTINVFSQVPTWLWGRDAVDQPQGGAIAVAVTKDPAGNIYSTGIIKDSLTFGSTLLVNTDTGFSATYIVKYDINGNLLWAKQSEGTGGSLASAITSDPAGNIYVTGYYFGGTLKFGALTIDTNTVDNIYIVKFDPNGNVLWLIDADSGAVGYPYGIAADLAGNFYLTGTIYSPTMKLGNTTLVDNGLVNYFVAKFNSSGQVLWATEAGESGIDKTYGITTDTVGNEYVTGFINSPQVIIGPDTLINDGTHNVFIARYDSSGHALWARSAQGIYGDLGFGIASDKSQNEYIIGQFTSPTLTFGATVLTCPGGVNTFIARYDSAGNIKWASASADTFHANIFPYSIAIDNHSNPVISGCLGYPQVGPVTFDTVTIAGDSGMMNPMFIVKYDSAGHSLWGKVLQIGGGDDNANGGLVCEADTIYVCAEFETDPFVIAVDTMHNFGIHTPFIAKLGYRNDVGISEIVENNSFIIYPNPNKGIFTIYGSQLTNNDFRIMDISGREVYHQLITHNSKLMTPIDISDLSNGIYFLQVISGNQILTNGKIVVQK